MNWKMTWGIYIYYLYIEYRLAHFEKKKSPGQGSEANISLRLAEKIFLNYKERTSHRRFYKTGFL